MGKLAGRICSCGRVMCRLELSDGQCAGELADDGPMSYDELAAVMGMHCRSTAEVAVKRALLAFVKQARALGYHQLVDGFRGIRGWLTISSREMESHEEKAA